LFLVAPIVGVLARTVRVVAKNLDMDLPRREASSNAGVADLRFKVLDVYFVAVAAVARDLATGVLGAEPVRLAFTSAHGRWCRPRTGPVVPVRHGVLAHRNPAK
jgi:hypothetical protein